MSDSAGETYVEDKHIGEFAPALRAGKTGRPRIHKSGGDLAVGTITFAANPAATDTITLDGIVAEFTAAASDATTAGTAGDPLLINIKASLILTLDEMLVVLNDGGAPAAAAAATYTEDGATVLTITNDTLGTAGNAFTLAASVDTVSAATLAGGEDSTALDVHTEHSNIAVKAGEGQDQNFTLGNGIDGQRHSIWVSEKQAGDVIVTPANLHGGTIITFSADLDLSLLQWIDGGWKQYAGDAVVS